MNKPREAAKRMLTPLVQRGDTIEQICSHSRVTAYGMLATVQIGGSVYSNGHPHKIGQKEIVVKELDGTPCLHFFFVADLVAEIRNDEALPASILLRDGSRQLLLWE